MMVYLPVRSARAGTGGCYTVAPVIILLSLGGLFLIWYSGLPVIIVLGFAVMALAWSLSRTVPAGAIDEPLPERLI